MNLAPQTISFDAIPRQIFGVSPFVVAAQSSSLLPVSFASTTSAVCRVASDLVMLLNSGTCSITASQAGNASYNAATSVTRNFTVSTANPAGTLVTAANSPFAVGSTPLSVAVGDFNGDGNQDYAVANYNDSTVTVLLGNGSGGFTASSGSPFSTGSSTFPESVVVGDFNGDGFLDLATANPGANSVTILLGNGAGVFSTASGSPLALGTSPRSLAVGDFNGDGIQDLVTANQSSNNVTVLLGNGTGGFTAASGSPFAVGSVPTSIVVADFNGDGMQDLATVNQSDNAATVLLGNGAGGFTAASGSPYTVGTAPTTLVAADFNGDGIPDLATANQNSGSNNVTVLLGNGTGGFTASPVAAGSGIVPYALAVGDLNGDGIPDIVTTNQTTASVSVLLGTGTGAFNLSAGAPFAVGTTPKFVAVSDFNGDGIEDIAVANSGSSNVTVLLGGPATTTSVLSSSSPQTIMLGQSVPLSLAVSDTSTAFSTPTGTATFLDGTTVLGTASQTSSPYTFTASSLGIGSHTLTASYGGDTRTSGSSSNAITITVTQDAQSISFGSLSNLTFGAAPFGISATATSGLTVTFASTTPSVCTISINTVTIVAAGTCSIAASQPGNATYAAATTVTQSFTVNPAPQTISLDSIPSQIFGAAPFATAASASSGLPVSISSTTSAVCQTAANLVTLVSAGTCTIAASQTGNVNYTAAPPATPASPSTSPIRRAP